MKVHIQHAFIYNLCLFSVNEFEELFEKKEVARVVVTGKLKSALSLQLEQFDSTPNNPFMEYSKFDGKVLFSVK